MCDVHIGVGNYCVGFDGDDGADSKNHLVGEGVSGEETKISFNYKTDGLSDFEAAEEEFKITEMWVGEFPVGDHIINVFLVRALQGSTDKQMVTKNSTTIHVNPDVFKTPNLGIVGAAIGHELSHVNDLLHGRTDTNQSEIRAYQWNRRNAKHFGLDFRYKTQINQLMEKYK